jgi:hypothetical protein
MMCDYTDDCRLTSNLATYMRDTHFTSVTYEEPMGLARDGHIIVGPYDENGELYGCDDVDVCNGTFLSDNSYAYALTGNFPYVIGCWGGRAWHLTEPVETTCTTHGCQTGAIANLALSLSLIAASLAATTF